MPTDNPTDAAASARMAQRAADAVADPDEGDGDMPDKLYFRIGEVAQLVGVDAHVLRYWESEFRMKPHRSSTGQRLYRKQDLARFLRVKALLHDEGYTIVGARKALAGGGAVVATVDPERVRAALSHVERLRRQIRSLRLDLLQDVKPS